MVSRPNSRWLPMLLGLIVLLYNTPQTNANDREMLNLTLRSRSATGSNKNDAQHREVQWDPQKTAVVICDMWDDHWCAGAASRVVELTEPINNLIAAMRAKGAIIIHAPSSVVDYYQGTPQRVRAQKAPFAKSPISLSTSERWGTCWCWPDPNRETDLPIDDSDMGCDCDKKCEIREAWTRQINKLQIAKQDFITDHGQEFFNVLQQHDIDNIMIMGVHLNMCVLGRPFGIRQATKLGKNVALVRDLTDSMYNHRKRPFVDHFSGHDLVVEHVERFWCPSFTSDQLVNGSPHRFAADKRP
ncbi:MAG: isochorismatase family protein [Pirellulaceae bacterium]|nr:isochorismatase family protein [Pirellulaceae bacterium]